MRVPATKLTFNFIMFAFFSALCAAYRMENEEIWTDIGRRITSFKFAANGTMEFHTKYYPTGIDHFSVQLMTNSEYNVFAREIAYDYNHYCKSGLVESKINFNITSSNFSETVVIENGGVYNLVAIPVVPAGSEQCAYTQLGFSVYMKNPNGFLDLRLTPGITAEVIVVAVNVIIAACWVVQMIVHFNKAKRMHFLITGLIFCPFIEHIFAHFYLSALNKADSAKPLDFFWVLFKVVSYTMLCFTILMATNGLSVLVETLHREMIMQELCASLLLVMSITIMSSWSDDGSKIFPVILGFFGIGFYARELVTSVSQGGAVVLAALVGTEGAASSTHIQYQRIEKLAIVAGVLVIVNMLIQTIDYWVDAWIANLIEGFSQLAVICGFCFIFMMKGISRFSYDSIDGSTANNIRKTEEREFLLDDLETTDIMNADGSKPLLA